MEPSVAYMPSLLARWSRRAVECLTMLCIAATLVHTFFVSGWLAPIVVSSSSMAPAFLGPTVRGQCPDCGRPLLCDAGAMSSTQTVACTTCGRRGIRLQDLVGGQRLLVNRAAAVVGPSRWQPFLFYDAETGDYVLKRVVGLPGESIGIKVGEVYVNRRIARKTLVEQRAMAVLVHDSQWSGKVAGAGERWISPDQSARREGATWISSGRQLRLELDPARGSVTDDDPYNPTVSRQLNPVSDLTLVAWLRLPPGQLLVIHSRYQGETFKAMIEGDSGAIALEREGHSIVAVGSAGLLDANHAYQLTFALLDQQVIIVVDGKMLVTYPFEVQAESPDGKGSQLSIELNGEGARIERLQLWRDVYYTGPNDGRAYRPVQLRDDEFYVLGDNSPISRDSRPWIGGLMLNRPTIIGRVLGSRQPE